MGATQAKKKEALFIKSIGRLREICLHSGLPRLGQKTTKGQFWWKLIKLSVQFSAFYPNVLACHM